MSEPDDHCPHVSIIVAAYNAAATLADCIDSLLRLDYPADRFELLCVDNASSDGTLAVLGPYRDRLIVLEEAKRGPAAARNAGVRRASGGIIALTDADCTVDPQWLRQLVLPLRDPRVGVAGGAILSKRPCNSIEAFGERIHDHDRALNELRPPHAITMNWATRKDVFDAVGPFNEDLPCGSDVDWSYRLAGGGFLFAYAPAAVVYHQNERTPWGLMREGYVHGLHGVRVARLHAAFIHRTHRPSHKPAAQSWRDTLWGCLFQVGKDFGRLHATLSLASRSSSRDDKRDLENTKVRKHSSRIGSPESPT